MEEKTCKKCFEKLPKDWMYDECEECMLNKKKKSKIIAGAAIGTTALAIAAITGVVFYKKKKTEE